MWVKTRAVGGGFDFDGSQIIKGDEGWQVDYRAGTVTPIAEPDFNTTAGPFIRVTAPLLVKQLQNRRQTSHWLGEVEFEGRPHDVITLVMEVGPALSLYFDKETHLLSRSERVLPPFGQVDYRFTDYETVDGIPFSKTFKLFVNDEPNIYIDIKSTAGQPADRAVRRRAGRTSKWLKPPRRHPPRWKSRKSRKVCSWLVPATPTPCLLKWLTT